MKVGFGRDKGRTCESIYKEAHGCCEWISRQDPTNPALLEFQEIIQIAEREWENESGEKKRRELEEREKNLEEHRRAAESEMEERQHLLQEAKNMLAEMDAEVRFGFAAMKRTVDTLAAARRDDDEATTKENTMAAARCDEERTATKTERGMEFLFVMGMEIPRNKMMIGVNTESGTEVGATTSKAVQQQARQQQSTITALGRNG